ncbi:MAG: hypothetical protein QMD77_03330 [Patescibacteria group bacterium]|nr:hypothetical protein [Patescibacteria group bacterium]
MGEIKEPKGPIKPPVKETPPVVPSAEKSVEEKRAEKIRQAAEEVYEEFIKKDLDQKFDRLTKGTTLAPEEAQIFRQKFINDRETIVNEVADSIADGIEKGRRIFDLQEIQEHAHDLIWAKMLDPVYDKQRVPGEKVDLFGPSVHPATGENDTTPSKAIAFHTIRKADNYDQLGPELKTEKSRDECIKKLARELIDQFTVHGMGRGDTFQLRSDLDGRTCLMLFEKAGFTVKKENVEYVEQGQTTKKESSWVADTSNRHGFVVEGLGKILITDHHNDELSGPDSSATKLLYDGLNKFGLLEKLNKKEKEILDGYVNFVTKEDNKDYTDDEIKSIFGDYTHNLYGLQRYLNDAQLYKIFEEHIGKQGKHFDPYKPLAEDYLKDLEYSESGKKLTFAEAKKKAETSLRMSNEGIALLEKEGFTVDTGNAHLGKILIDVGRDDKGIRKNRVGMKFAAARAKDYGVYIEWSPDTGYFSVQTAKQMGFQTMQGKNVRGKYLLKADGEETLVTLRQILAGLTGDPNYQIDESLKKALEKDLKARETKRKKERAEFKPTAEQENTIDRFLKHVETHREKLLALLKEEGTEAEYSERDREMYFKSLIADLYKEYLSGRHNFPEEEKEERMMQEYIQEKFLKNKK